MKSFKEFDSVNEAEYTPEMLMRDIEESFLKHFPLGYFRIKHNDTSRHPHINIRFGLIEDIQDVSSQIRENDPLYHGFMVWINGDSYEARQSQGSLSVNPAPGSVMAMESVKTKFGKTTGNGQKIAKYFDKFFARTKKLVKDNEADVYGRDRIADKYFK